MKLDNTNMLDTYESDVFIALDKIFDEDIFEYKLVILYQYSVRS